MKKLDEARGPIPGYTRDGCLQRGPAVYNSPSQLEFRKKRRNYYKQERVTTNRDEIEGSGSMFWFHFSIQFRKRKRIRLAWSSPHVGVMSSVRVANGRILHAVKQARVERPAMCWLLWRGDTAFLETMRFIGQGGLGTPVMVVVVAPRLLESPQARDRSGGTTRYLRVLSNLDITMRGHNAP